MGPRWGKGRRTLGKGELTVWDEYTFDLSYAIRGCHGLRGLVPPRTARFRVASIPGARSNLDLIRQSSKVPSRWAMSLRQVGWPTLEKGPFRLMEQNLEDAGDGAGLGNVGKEALVEEVALLLAHFRRAAPIGPRGF